MAEAGEYGVFIVSRVSYLIINYVAGDELDLEYRTVLYVGVQQQLGRSSTVQVF